MNISEIERSLKELEKKLSQVQAEAKPLQDKVDNFMQEITETNTEYEERLRKIRDEQRNKIDELQRLRYDAQAEMFEAKAQAGKIETMMRSLRQDHADALKAIAAKERLEQIYKKIADFFEDAPWAPYIKDFQKEDVVAIVSAYEEGKSGILNANVMGAGKTFETGAVFDILTALFYKEHGRKPLTLWITRKALMKSTAAELLEWNPNRKFAPISGTAEMKEMLLDIAVQANIPVIINYEGLRSEKVQNIKWDITIMDECHKIKGGEDVQVFHNTKKITRNARFFLGLSGSPIQNAAKDIWPVFNILDEFRFPSVRRFEREFLRERWDDKKKKYVNGVDEERLINVMQGQVIKQNPKIIQSAWPDKRRIFKIVEMNGEQRKVYDRCKQGIISHFQKEAETDPNKTFTITAIIAQLTYLRQINVYPGGVTVQSPNGEAWSVNCHESAKLDEAESLIEDLTAEGEQVVVWSAQFNGPLFELQRRLQTNFPELTVVTMTGKTPDADRSKNEVKFQQGEIDVLLCNRGAFSEGFNFQKNPGRWSGGASKAIFLDAWWNPKANEQAEDRIWRTGQSDNVDIYYIYTDDSVDAFIAAKLDEKEAMIKGIMDSDQLRPADVIGILDELL